MNSLLSTVAVIAALLLTPAVSVRAVEIPVDGRRLDLKPMMLMRTAGIELPLDGTWLELAEQSDDDGGFSFQDRWTWTSTRPVLLCLTDLYVPGDEFEVYDNGRLLGATQPADPLFSGAFAMTPDEALYDLAFSQACWLLDPGFHSITIRTLKKPLNYGNEESYAAIRGVAVPEGVVGWIALGSAMAGLIGIRSLSRVRRSGASRACSVC